MNDKQLRDNPRHCEDRGDDAGGTMGRSDDSRAPGHEAEPDQGQAKPDRRRIRLEGTVCARRGGKDGGRRDLSEGQNAKGAGSCSDTLGSGDACKRVCNISTGTLMPVGPAHTCRSERRSPLGIRSGTEQQGRGRIQAAGSTVHGGVTTYCPTCCPYLGRNGCRVACGNEEIECPVMTGKIKAEEADRVQADG